MVYQLFKHVAKIEEIEIDTYGIVLFMNGTEILRMYDVSTDYNSISNFVKMINASHLDPFQLGQALEKYLNEY
ncbi:MAG: hypothetical protein IKW45_00285 [Clostridia bacterium]|nr:hypothetical protein [Clostridia bacterium]